MNKNIKIKRVRDHLKMFSLEFRRIGRIIRSTMSQSLESSFIGEYDIGESEYFWSFCKFHDEYWANLERITRRIISNKLLLPNYIGQITFGELYWANYEGRIIERICILSMKFSNHFLFTFHYKVAFLSLKLIFTIAVSYTHLTLPTIYSV